MDKIPVSAGGKPFRDKYIIFGSPIIEKPEIDDVVDSLTTGWLGTGPKVMRFEEAFKEYVEAKYAVAVNSCTAALHLALLVIDLPTDAEVITTPLTFTATAASIIHAGANPIFVDVDQTSMNITTEFIEPAITEKTKAIIPVHFAGRPCNMKNITELSGRYGLRIIEDAAHAIEAVSQGKKIGSIGDLTCFSFYVTKNIVTGEGGMVTTNNEEYAEKIKVMALHGMTKDAWHRFTDQGFKHYQVICAGFKYNMTDIQAAIGYNQLNRIEQYASRRKKIWNYYNDEFKELPVIMPSDTELAGDRHARHLYTLLLKIEDLRINRDQFMEALHKENIGTGVHYIALHLHPYYAERYKLKRGMFPNAEYISDRTVSIPLSAKLNDTDVEDIVEAVSRILNYYAK